jgi:hypothetical protein
MYHPNVACTPPENDSIKVWRYMTFTKFMSVLDRSALYFARVDRLGDPFEGSFARKNLSGELRPVEMIQVHESIEPGSKWVGSAPMTAEHRALSFAHGQKSTHANCWHMNNYESAAMWSVYSRSGEGIAIQSTYGQLRDSFTSPDHKQDVTIGMVKYIDYERDAVPESSVLYRYLHKRKSFEHEHELRVLSMDYHLAPIVPGRYIDVTLATLIQAVYVSPKSTDWFTELVSSMVADMVARRDFGRAVPVINSRLDETPLH